jgi:hypothetical protein
MTRFDLDPNAPSDLAIRSILDGLAHVVGEAERKWGTDRLRLLVDDTLRARFDRQALLLDQAVASNLEVEIRLQAEAMKRAYAALDKAAHVAGAKKLDAAVWEVTLPGTGEIVGIVRTEADLASCQRGTAFTLDEIGRLLSGLPSAVATIKAAWPQARIERAGPMDWQRGDELPPELRA